MNFLPRVTRTITLLLILLLTACAGQEDPPSDAPANVAVTEGSGLVVVDWDVVSGRTYWIIYKQGTDTSLTEYDKILLNVSPPYILTALTNDTEYAFSVTSSQNGSKVGPFSPVTTATPRLLSPSITWTIGTALGGGANNLQSIVLGSNTYVTVGDAATVFTATYDYPSTGGIDADTGWSAATLPDGYTANLNSAIYNGTLFIALGDDGSVIKSTDAEALTWEAATATGVSGMNAMATGAGLTVAVGDAGEIVTSSDSATTAWTTQTSGTVNNLYGISYLNGNFIAVGAVGTVLTSTNAIDWTEQTAVTGNSLRSVAYGASTYIAVGDAGTIVSSSDTTTWADQTTNTITQSLYAISFGTDAQFVTVGTSGVNAYSSTGADGSWLFSTSNAGSIDLSAIAPSLTSAPLYIAVGAAGTNVSGK